MDVSILLNKPFAEKGKTNSSYSDFQISHPLFLPWFLKWEFCNFLLGFFLSIQFSCKQHIMTLARLKLQELAVPNNAPLPFLKTTQSRYHTFVEIDHEIISTVILLPSADLFKKGCCQLQAKVCAQITG